MFLDPHSQMDLLGERAFFHADDVVSWMLLTNFGSVILSLSVMLVSSENYDALNLVGTETGSHS